MEVILLEDVKSLGKKGELVKVSDGYARNYIIKRNLGKEATAKTLMSLNCRKNTRKKLHRKSLIMLKHLPVN